MSTPNLLTSQNESLGRPRYDLKHDELVSLSSELTELVSERFPEEGVVAVWLGPNSKYSNIVRTNEARHFPEITEVEEAIEENTLFLALVDTRPYARRVVHGASLTGVGAKDEVVLNTDKGPVEGTGFNMIDELIECGGLTAEEFRSYYASRGIDLDKSIAVETNLHVGEESDSWQPFGGLDSAQLAYLTIFNLATSNGAEVNAAVAFATINEDQIRSLEKDGIPYEPFMDRTDFDTPEASQGRVSLPVVIPYNTQTQELFSALQGHVLPQISLS